MLVELKYIELKTGHDDNGPAWVGMVEFSKTRKTIYFNGKALTKGRGVQGNYLDIENGDEYWVSGIKKNGNDRHSTGGGKILIDKNIVDKYLSILQVKSLDKNRFELTEIKPTDKQQIKKIENRKLI